MSERETTSESASGQPNIGLTPDEKRVFGQLFAAADSENLGVVTGELAVKFFEKSGLNPRILGEIWGIADTENRGLLTKVGFSVALRLIGQAQAGQHPRPELALTPGPLPRFDGLNISYPPSVVPPTTSSPPPPNVPPPPPGGPVRVPQLTDADCKKFTELFQVSGAVDGVLPGDAAKQIFTRAKLPNQTLGLIWNLADRQQKGALTCPEFVVAMHLINCCKNGSIQTLPVVLPAVLYDAASGRPPARLPADRRPTGRGVPPAIPTAPAAIPKQFSGSGVRAQSPLSRQFTPPAPLNPTMSGNAAVPGGEWAISAREKAEFDNLFNNVDRSGRGFITGEEAVPFFSNSKLPEGVLATIWDLADITKAGRLSQDEFAIAMYLIRQQRTRRDGKGLPETLPLNLIPPSMRAQVAANSLPPTNFYNPPPPPPAPASSSINDLFGLDSFGPSTSAPPPNPPTGGQSFSPYDNAFQTQSKPATPQPPPPSASMFTIPQSKFVPTSEYGQMLAASATGNSTASAPRATSVMEDLLGDNDPEVNKKITPDTIELANLSNQIGTLTKQTQEQKNKRTVAEQELNTFNQQKHDIEVRLAQIKAIYEREAKDVAAVEDRLHKSRTETMRLRQEYAIAEAQLNEYQTKRRDVATQLEQDQRENLELKERMRLVNQENQQLKQQLEKLQQDAKQQKRLVAISKQQLASSEGDREKLKSEIEEARSAAAAVAATAVVSPIPGSPTLSQASVSTNPFYRGRSPPAPESAFQSPYATGNSTFASGSNVPPQNNYDDVFGESAFNSSAGPPPPTSFGQSVPSAPSASEGPFENSTPPTSPPASSYQNSPQAFDPPPPSTSSQLTSAFLPLPSYRAESVTSSVQVNPPASVQDSNASRPDTPTNWMNGPTGSSERDIFAQSEERRASTSVRSDPGTEPALRSFSRTESPFAPAALPKSNTGPTTGDDLFRKGHEKKDSFGFPTQYSNPTAGMPGAFSQPIKPTATGESTFSTKSKGSTMSRPEVSFVPRSDPFSLNRGDDKAASASKEDMDAAFGGFGLPRSHLQERQNTGGSAMSANFNSEFPPIEELDNNEEDSDSDIGGGFEDNFTSPAPTHGRAVPPTTSAPPEGFEPSSKPGTPLPGFNDQQSPPIYKSEQSADKNPFPQEFKGLLPSRTDPLTHDAPTPGGSTNTVLYPAHSGAQQTNTAEGTTTAPVPQTSFFPTQSAATKATTPFDEFDDDAFGDLADAQEVDGKTDHDDFGVLAVNDSVDEFSDIFDSPAPKTTKTGNTGKNAQGDDEDFTKFDFNIDTPGGNPVASSQDWDAIFAGLEDSKQPPSNAGSAVNEGAVNTTGTGPAAASGENSGPKNSDHEEELTKLTGMGFTRESSLKALEQFNYDIVSVRLQTTFNEMIISRLTELH
ncbi:hypothetical protein DFH27DRAFT_482667 [Peziza echinospora]|nr:hypothetical protein DFH27DRAFT_482667 [Peziza echinospora]